MPFASGLGLESLAIVLDDEIRHRIVAGIAPDGDVNHPHAVRKGVIVAVGDRFGDDDPQGRHDIKIKNDNFAVAIQRHLGGRSLVEGVHAERAISYDDRMLIRPATNADEKAVWSIIGPTIRAGETYTLPPDMSMADALAYWMGSDRETFVVEDEGRIVGTYYIRANQAGGGDHVCNCGYMTHSAAIGRGVARTMCEHSISHARSRGFQAMQFNFVVSTNDRAVRLWQSLGFKIVGRLPHAFRHPTHGLVDALVMFQPL